MNLLPCLRKQAADRVVTFVDLGGHRKCLKTALFGMTCMAPDYALLTVAAPNGVGAMTREHLAALLAMRVPTFAVLTQTDLCTGSLRETAFHVQVRAPGSDCSCILLSDSVAL